MRKKTASFHTVLAVLVLATGPAQAGLFDKPPEAVMLTAESKPAEAFKALIDDGAALRHISKPYAGPSAKAAIGMVRVNFITDASDTAATKEFMGKATVSASSQMKLVGVSPEQMQAVANAFHAALRERLAAQGYQVVEQSALLEDADFKKAVADTKPVDSSSGGKVTSVYAAGTGNLMTFGMRNFAYNQKMPVYVANVTLNFAAFDKETARWAEGGSAISASITSKVVSAVSGYVRVMTEDGGGPQFDFVRPMVLPGVFAERVEKVQKSDGEVAGTVALRVLGSLLGSRDSGSAEAYQVFARGDYPEVLGGDMKLLAGVLAQALNKREQ